MPKQTITTIIPKTEVARVSTAQQIKEYLNKVTISELNKVVSDEQLVINSKLVNGIHVSFSWG